MSEIDINSFGGELVLWCPNCGARHNENDLKNSICPKCGYDANTDGWDLMPPENNGEQ